MMTDLEITTLCAEALGWLCYQETRGDYSLCVTQAPGEDPPWKRSRNSEHEKKRYKKVSISDAITIGFFGRGLPDPLHDDAQLLSLARKFPLEFEQAVIEWANHVRRGEDFDVNRCFCDRIARTKR